MHSPLRFDHQNAGAVALHCGCLLPNAAEQIWRATGMDCPGEEGAYLCTQCKRHTEVIIVGDSDVVLAAHNNRVAELRKLLREGGSANAEIAGVTALGAACAKGHAAAVQVLLLYGANPYLPSQKPNNNSFRNFV